MKISISQIAWNQSEDEQIFKLLKNLDIHNMESTPTKLKFNSLYKNESKQIILALKKYDIKICALQSLLYDYPDLNIFSTELVRQKLLSYLINVISTSHDLGIKVLIFGSPRNKIKGSLSFPEAFELTVEFFGKLALEAQKKDIIFCIEPTPKAYGADFILNNIEALALVKAVNVESFKINLDLGSIILNDENVEKTIAKMIKYSGHFHISEPYLKKIHLDLNFHQLLAEQLRMQNYKGMVSVEMLANSGSNIRNITNVLKMVKKIYG